MNLASSVASVSMLELPHKLRATLVVWEQHTLFDS